jgi:hypothetical protein
MMRGMRSLLSMAKPTSSKESGFLVSLTMWGLCFGIRTKILWLFAAHGRSSFGLLHGTVSRGRCRMDPLGICSWC